MRLLAISFLFLSLGAFSQKKKFFQIDSLPKQGILLDKGWKWHAGDNPDFAKADFDDSKWESIDPTMDIFDLPQIPKNGEVFWFRIRLNIEPLQQKVVQLNQSGASEIYLDGKLIQTFGEISKNPSEIIAFTPNYRPFSWPISENKGQVLAIRYAFQPNISYGKHFGQSNMLFSATIYNFSNGKGTYEFRIEDDANQNYFVGTFGILFILFFTFFLFFPHRKESLYFTIFSLALLCTWLFFDIAHRPILVKKIYLLNNIFLIFQTVGYVSLLRSAYLILGQKIGLTFWLLVIFSLLAILTGTFIYNWGWFLFGFGVTNLINLDVTRLAIISIKKQKQGAWIMVAGGLIYLFSWLFFCLEFAHIFSINGFLPFNINFFFISIISIPISFAVYFGYDFGVTNRSLQQKLEEVENLSAEKQQILTTQNEKLEIQVAQRTAELVHKNRDLEIEGALERVRSKTMAMHKSDQLAGVMSILCKEILSLGIHKQDMETCYITTFEGSEPIGEIYLTTSNGDLIPDSFRARYDEDYYFKQIFEAWINGNSSLFLHAEGDELLKHFAFLYNSIPKTSSIREMREEDHRQLPSETFNYILFFSNGYLDVVTRIPVPEYYEVFKRFGSTLQQAYTRFLDLQKAEVQVREAEIEAALERVRSRTMAMQHSAELSQAANLLSNEVRKLGIPIWSCGYNIMEKDEKACLGWMSTEGSIQPSFRIPLKVSPTFIKFYESRQNGVELFEEQIGGADLETHYNYMLTLPDFAEIIKGFINSGNQLPTFQVNTVVNFKQGNLIFISAQPVPEAHDIFKRFAYVFEQTFTRFLDLQNAETQAREAQIEAALERVRSRSMAMQNSEELNAVIGKIFAECTALDIALDSGAIIIYDEKTIDTKWWMTNREDPNYPLRFRIQQNNYPFNNALQLAWNEKAINWNYTLGGLEKKEWDKYIYSKTDFALLPEHIKEVMGALEKIYIKASFNQFGCLMLTNIEPLQEAELTILPRFSKVFEQTYTRFLDLQKAEAQAEQAKIDLIQIQTEKKRAEDALTILKATQAQLIQKEKLASLGELTAGIAHEIQNPLNFVNNFSEVSSELVDEMNQEIDKGDSTEAKLISNDLKQNLEKITLHGKRASSIVKGMLEHSRTSTGEKELTDINALADEYLRLTYHGLRAKDKDFNSGFKTDFDENLPKIEVIPQDIGRVLLNLINNAFYATKGVKNPLVEIKTARVVNGILVSVRDNAKGMSEETKAKIFQPFFTTKPTGEGTGLGLSLAYDIVTKGHGGTIEVESMEGVGSEFKITLPIKVA